MTVLWNHIIIFLIFIEVKESVKAERHCRIFIYHILQKISPRYVKIYVTEVLWIFTNCLTNKNETNKKYYGIDALAKSGKYQKHVSITTLCNTVSIKQWCVICF